MIKGKKIFLRAIEKEDTLKYYEWINDSETNQWRGLFHPYSREDAQAWIETHRSKSSEHLSLAIQETSKYLIGFIGLRNICPRSRRAEIWIYIGSKEHWGKSFGYDAIKTICDYAFLQMNLFRLWLECNPEYAAVVKCYEKVGFVKEGTLRKGYYREGKFRDTCIMAFLREDWEKVSNREKL